MNNCCLNSLNDLFKFIYVAVSDRNGFRPGSQKESSMYRLSFDSYYKQGGEVS